MLTLQTHYVVGLVHHEQLQERGPPQNHGPVLACPQRQYHQKQILPVISIVESHFEMIVKSRNCACQHFLQFLMGICISYCYLCPSIFTAL